jgi:hypothetical protein
MHHRCFLHCKIYSSLRKESMAGYGAKATQIGTLDDSLIQKETKLAKIPEHIKGCPKVWLMKPFMLVLDK